MVPKIFEDTSVLFPFSIMDLLLALAEHGVIEVLWTDELLVEWERVIVREHRRSPESAASVVSAIREFFDDSRIDPQLYKTLVASMPGPDPDDHVHSAAAIAANADALLTFDESGFPSKKLAPLGLRVADPDTYLVELLDSWRVEVLSVLDVLAESKEDPPMSVDDVLNALRRAGVARFVAQVRDDVEGVK